MESMIGDLTSPLELRPDYLNADAPGFLLGIVYLVGKYDAFRKVVGDGNCFYRAFLFSYLEQLHLYRDTEIAKDELIRMKTIIFMSKQELVDIGYSELAIESFHDVRDILQSYGIFTTQIHFI